jgi:hypothetical protein
VRSHLYQKENEEAAEKSCKLRMTKAEKHKRAHEEVLKDLMDLTLVDPRRIANLVSPRAHKELPFENSFQSPHWHPRFVIFMSVRLNCNVVAQKEIQSPILRYIAPTLPYPLKI